MLKKSISLSANSVVTYEENEVTAVRLTAKVGGTGERTNNNSVVVNEEAYNANYEQCRADMDEFTAWVRKMEDTMRAEES